MSNVSQILKPWAAWLFGAGLLTISFCFLEKAGSSIAHCGSALWFLFVGALSWSAAFRGCKTGVVLFEGGFEQFRGPWPSRKVYFSEITRIDAVRTGWGAQGNKVMLVLHAAGRKVKLGERDFNGTRLRREILALPGFRGDQYALAADYHLKGLEHLFFKSFVVFEKTLPGTQPR
jgi:hypothetical protein